MHDFWPEGRRYTTQENQQSLSSRAGLEAAWRQQVVLEGLALRCDPAHNLTVQLGDTVGVIPREECALGIREGTTRDIAILTCVGRAVSFVVTGFENGVPQLSRRLAQERALAQLLQCQPGDILPRHRHPPGALRRFRGHRLRRPLPAAPKDHLHLPHPPPQLSLPTGTGDFLPWCRQVDARAGAGAAVPQGAAGHLVGERQPL